MVKRKPDSTIEKYKDRKVARGFTQVDEVNYDSEHTYAQMMRPQTLKKILIVALY